MGHSIKEKKIIIIFRCIVPIFDRFYFYFLRFGFLHNILNLKYIFDENKRFEIFYCFIIIILMSESIHYFYPFLKFNFLY